ncbi:MAG: DNA-3-methyladenine glycosylase I [Lachnospiraceae bacterium]|nr:DNA-3-methyladenine glycosylase I [Lachnospiraceae bacterium]
MNELKEKELCRCRWCNSKNPIYIEYHDHEWCVPEYRDELLLELLILESFQAGLSWECVLNKREYFREAFDGFALEKVCVYDESKVAELLQNKNIIRNRLKVNAAINNARIFRKIQEEYGSFVKYIWGFTDGMVIYEVDKTSSELSDRVSADLKKRGMKFVGTTIIYSYLQAIGVLYSHDKECFLFREHG